MSEVPYPGDVRVRSEVDFDVFDGAKWVNNRHGNDAVVIEDPGYHPTAENLNFWRIVIKGLADE